jgi:hypothetical protein
MYEKREIDPSPTMVLVIIGSLTKGRKNLKIKRPELSATKGDSLYEGSWTAFTTHIPSLLHADARTVEQKNVVLKQTRGERLSKLLINY